ncbi:MAG: hypothetical protein ISN28_05940 [Ectothiorhodospiraceae bacterium AqS1]|nr:hypothetical protein [Ectothiorhodospiraceae bacterium AqS1]
MSNGNLGLSAIAPAILLSSLFGGEEGERLVAVETRLGAVEKSVVRIESKRDLFKIRLGKVERSVSRMEGKLDSYFAAQAKGK